MLTTRGGRRRRLPAGVSTCARMQRVRIVAICVEDLPANGFRMRTADITDCSKPLYGAIVERQRGLLEGKGTVHVTGASPPSHISSFDCPLARRDVTPTLHSIECYQPHANASKRNPSSDSVCACESHEVDFVYMLPEGATQCETRRVAPTTSTSANLGHEQRTTRCSHQRPSPSPQWKCAPRA
jgi:hypothetical protein